MLLRSISLKLDEKVDFVNGFTFQVSKKCQSLVVFLNGEYENKMAISSARLKFTDRVDAIIYICQNCLSEIADEIKTTKKRCNRKLW